MADRLAAYQPVSILEIGCGYGKLLGALRAGLDVPLVGVDFSPTQLDHARELPERVAEISIPALPRRATSLCRRSFDMVVTSAVILHNPPATAERIRREVLRVASRFAAHNEETSISYNRYGYDTAAWYRRKGITLAESGPIPMDPDPRTHSSASPG